METIVLKFGGSSLADNAKLNIVANKITQFYNQKKKVVVVVSAQGKTTDKLIKEAKELCSTPNDREMDVLLSTGEQISISKLSILLNSMGYSTISLTGWQAGIYTSEKNQEARIENIDTNRINKELDKNNIVIVAGFQGINKKHDITTLGRGGSDTTAIAIAAAIKADHCYIFSDVDGVYSADPNKVTETKKLDSISYKEMLDLSDEGAKVLHNRCVEIAQKYDVLIEAASTFSDSVGTIICDKIEESSIKSIVKNDDLVLVNLNYEKYENEIINKIYLELLENGIPSSTLINNSINDLNINFTIKASHLDKLKKLIENNFTKYEVHFTNISRISIVGYGIANNKDIIESICKICNSNNLPIISIQVDECKISIMTKERVSDKILEQLHHELIS